ncbi:MAG: tartrate-resistant acid phosphatase type 5 family protein [Hyphomonadaceae bacterium]
MRFAISRRSLLTATAALVAAPRAYASPGRLDFLVVGDWGDPHVQAQREVATAMGEVAGAAASDFVISTGDNFYNRGVRSTTDPQWRTTFEEIYTAPSLQTPWYVVLGNHDYAGVPGAEVAYTATSPRWRMPARYWREDMSLSDDAIASFFFLDTTPITRLAGVRDHLPGTTGDARPQLRWLEQELAACTSRWKILVGHHPILSSGNHGPSQAVAEHLRPLIERYRVQAYINGHDHDLEHLQENGVHYICSGSGSEARSIHAVPQSRFAYAHTGFASCALTSSEFRLTFYDSAGRNIYEALLD